MKNKLILYMVLFSLIGLIAFAIVDHGGKELTVTSKGDEKGVIVGNQMPQYEESDPSKWTSETLSYE